MDQPRTRSRAPLLLALAALVAPGCGTTAAQTPATLADAPGNARSFDLLVYGSDFDPGEHEVFLRTNLAFGGEWVSLGSIQPADGWSTAVFPALSIERFLGQDHRESYLDLRIVTAGGSDESRIAAIYAMPHHPGLSAAAASVTRLIESDPARAEWHSLASHVQPRPAVIGAGTDYVEHVRAPMAGGKPGVAEVLQLEVEWRYRGR